MELQGGTYRECRGYAAGQCLNFVVNGFLSVKVYRGYRGGDAGFFGKGERGGSRLLKKNEYARFSRTEQFKALSNE